MKVIRPKGITSDGGFTRSTTKKFIGSNGLLQTAAIDVPAFEFDLADLSAAPVALIEGACANLLTYTEDFANVVWQKAGVTVAANSAVAPDGAATADTLTSTGADATVLQSVSGLAAGSDYTLSLWISSSVPTTINCYMIDGDGSSGQSSATFDITSTPRRFTMSRMTGSATTILLVQLGGGASFSIGKALRVWGAQLELGGAATSYVPRLTSAAAARAADVITGAAQSLVYSNVVETYAPYSSGTSYALGARCINNTTHRVYESAQAGNSGHDPTLAANLVGSPPWWIDIGPTNRWALFDSVVGTVAQATDQFNMMLRPGAIDTVALLNLVNGNFATVALIDGTTTVYKGKLDLTGLTGVGDYWEYFFEEVASVTDAVFLDIPRYGDAILSVSIVGAGAVGGGLMVNGQAFDLGGTQYGARVGIISYTKKFTDSAGRTSAKKGENSKRMNLTTVLENSVVDAALRVCAELDGIATVWIGTDNLFGSLITFGFCKDFEIVIAYYQDSLCSYSIEGLT